MLVVIRMERVKGIESILEQIQQNGRSVRDTSGRGGTYREAQM